MKDIVDELDDELNQSQGEEENFEGDEVDEEYDDETQDPEGVIASDGETDGEARLLNRGEQLRSEKRGDALLEEAQVRNETPGLQEKQGGDTKMREVEESDGSDSEPLAAKRPVTAEKRGRGRPPGKSTASKGEGASSSKKVPISVDNPLGRQPGKSLFPMSRVTKVLKADKVCLVHPFTYSSV
jgi:hypothetical protein